MYMSPRVGVHSLRMLRCTAPLLTSVLGGRPIVVAFNYADNHTKRELKRRLLSPPPSSHPLTPEER